MVSMKNVLRLTKTVHFRIFSTFSIVILFIMTLLFALQYANFRSVQEKQQFDYMVRFTSAIQESIDANYQSVIENATRLCTSNPLKNYFFGTVDNPIDLFINSKGLRDTIRSILGINNAYPLIEIYRQDAFVFQMDETFQGSIRPENPFATDLHLQAAIANKGKITVCAPVVYSPVNRKAEKLIPVAMSFSKKLGTIQDNVIILYDRYDHLGSMINTILPRGANGAPPAEIALILDRQGQLIFPDPTAPDPRLDASIYRYDYTGLLRESELATNSSVHKLAIGDRRYVSTLARSSLTGYTTLVLRQEQLYNQSMSAATRNLVQLYLFVILAVLIVTYHLSKSLTNPIKKIMDAIRTLSLEESGLASLSLPNSNLYELERLSEAYKDMTQRLRQSLDEVVSARSHELQSRLLAMQAQMNPHFLYNILSVVSVLAEEQGAFDVTNICSNLSQMLRYVSSKSLDFVTIEDEITHSCIYHDLMKNRYGDNTRLNLDIPESILQVMIPKLIIQPLVENSMKYGLDVDPPWIIRIRGWQEADRWHLEVSDNGPGFSAAMLAEWQQKIATINIMHTEMALATKGVGLLNIYIRLKLHYGDQMQFELGNALDGGAVIHLSGIIR